MTILSVGSGLLTLLWCVAIFFSIVGWGTLVASLLRIKQPGVAITFALGLALQCGIGGTLNLVHGITRPVLLVLFLAGAILALRYFQQQRVAVMTMWQGLTHQRKLLVAVAACLVALYLVCFIRASEYAYCDDLQAYLLLPTKMFQQHYLPADPFSQRRIIGSLAFNYYLSDLFLVLAPLKNLSLVDGCLGILLLVSSAFALCRMLKLTFKQTLLICLVSGITKEIFFNLSFVWLPCGLFLAVALLAAREEQWRENRNSLFIAIGLLGATMTAVKNNYVVFALPFMSILYALVIFLPRSPLFAQTTSFKDRGILFAKALIISGGSGTAILLLWMIAQHHYTGTYFFPILGHGYEFSSYGLLPARGVQSHRILVRCVLAGMPLVLIAAFEIKIAKLTFPSLAIISSTLAGAVATIATGIAAGGDSVRRYTFPEFTAGLLLMLPLLYNARNQSPKPRRLGMVGALAVCGILFIFATSDSWTLSQGAMPWRLFADHLDADFLSGLRNAPLVSPTVVAEYRQLEEAVPQGAVALQTVAYPFLLDNTHATYYEASLPAMASPPPAPGWPIFSSGETLGKWLVSHQVRYLIYSYGDLALQRDFEMPARIADPRTPVILRSTWTANLRAHAQYLELGATRKHIFDDGHIFVLDLTQPSAQ